MTGKQAEDVGTDNAALTHIDGQGRAHMVDVTSKPLTQRIAVAKCAVITEVDALKILSASPDGLNCIEAARFAGIQGAKQTPSLIPLCHGIRIDRVEVELDVKAHRVDISAVAGVTERTGVEMEALTACAVAALTILGVLQQADPRASIEELTLWHKSGGRSGVWERDKAITE